MSMENLGPYSNFHELNQDWFLDEFNKLVKQWESMQKNFDSLQDAFNDLKSYVQDYFKNLDVQEEINKKLDDMYRDGTLEKMFSIPTNENLSKILLASFFSSNDDIENTLYISGDGINFNKIGNGIRGRDVDIIFNNGIFYMCYTHKSTTPLCDFSIATSSDLINYNYSDIYLNDLTEEMPNSMAPNWFIDGNNIYIIYSKQIGTMVYNESIYPKYAQFLTKIKSLKDLTFEHPIQLTLPDINIIDGSIIKKDDTYFLFVKKELDEEPYTGGTIMEFTSADLFTWSLLNKEITSFSGKYEAPSVVEYNGIYFLYADNYGNDDGSFYHYSTSTDLINWNMSNAIECVNPTRHGCVLPVDNFKLQSIISDFSIKYNSESFAINQGYYNKNIIFKQTKFAINKWLDLLNMTFPENYKSVSLLIHFSDVETTEYNSIFTLTIKRQNEFTVTFNEISYETVSAKNVLKVRKNNDNSFTLFIDVNNISNMTPSITILSLTKNRGDVKLLNNINSKKEGTVYVSNLRDFNFNANQTKDPLPSDSIKHEYGTCGFIGKLNIINIRFKSLINMTTSNTVIYSELNIPYDTRNTNVSLNCIDITDNNCKVASLNTNGEINVYGLLENHEYIVSGVYMS